MEKKKQLTEEELGGVPEAACCLVFITMMALLLSTLVGGFQTQKHIQGTVARVTWTRIITIEQDLGGRSSRNEVIWERIDKLEVSGDGTQTPYWPEYTLQKDQRVGFRIERYGWYITCDDGKTRVSDTRDRHRWELIPQGTRVTLGIDGFDGVNSIARVTSASIENVTSD
jgi:hypothetical protein